MSIGVLNYVILLIYSGGRKMREFKGTPGPWHAVNYGGYFNLQTTAFYSGRNDLLNEDKNKLAAENAQLAAAAPDLLKALRLALSTPQNEWDGNKLRICQNAIDKALGKENELEKANQKLDQLINQFV